MNLKKIRFEVEVEGTAVARPDVPIFTTLNVDGPFSLPPAPSPPYSMQPPLCYFYCVNEG